MQKKAILLKAISYNISTLNLFYSFLLNLFTKYNFQSKLAFLKKKKKKITLLKSAHVHKKAREQFQMTKFSYLICFFVQESKISEFFYLVKLNVPKNIDLNFTIVSTETNKKKLK